jgi:hypothetical protein
MTAEESEQRQAGFLSHLKGTSKGKGKSRGEIAKAMGLEAEDLQSTILAIKRRKPNPIKMEGSRSNATCYLA